MSYSTRVVIARRLRFLPHRVFAVAMQALFQGRVTTLRRPRTWSELLAVRNLRPAEPLVRLTADKYAVRAHVADRVGDQYLIPLLQVADRAEDLEPANFPGPCVVKGTHGCDMTLLLPDPSAVDPEALRATVRKWLATDFYTAGWRENPYRGMPRRVVVEQFIGDGRNAPTDYKFFMFHGEPAVVVIDQDRFGAHTSTLLTPDWREFDIRGRFAFAEELPAQPPNYAEMLDVARKLSTEFDFVRIDLYNVDGRVYFGEITHYPGGGVVRLQPRAFDLALGELWRTGTPIPERFVKPRAADRSA